jgi:hypothetical protein
MGDLGDILIAVFFVLVAVLSALGKGLSDHLARKREAEERAQRKRQGAAPAPSPGEGTPPVRVRRVRSAAAPPLFLSPSPPAPAGEAARGAAGHGDRPEAEGTSEAAGDGRFERETGMREFPESDEPGESQTRGLLVPAREPAVERVPPARVPVPSPAPVPEAKRADVMWRSVLEQLTGKPAEPPAPVEEPRVPNLTERLARDDAARVEAPAPGAAPPPAPSTLSPSEWRRGIVLAEILGPPLALRDPSGGHSPPA